MGELDWRDRIVDARMRVDQEFAAVVASSSFTRSEWGMIMTAVEFEIEGDGASARLVADTSRLDLVLAELPKVADRTGVDPNGSTSSVLSNVLRGGLIDSIRSALGLSSTVDGAQREEATRLADEYARALQSHLEEHGRWEDLRTLATTQQPGPRE